MAVMPEKPQMKGQKDFPKVQMVATNFKSFISTARSSKLTLPFTEEKPSQGKVWPEKLNKGCTVLCWSRRRRTAGPAPASDALHSHERRSWRVKPLLIYPHDTWWSPWRSHRQWLTWSKPLEWLLPDPRQYHEAEWSPVWQAITCELMLTNLLKLCHWGILHAISLKSSSAISPISFRRGSVCVSHSWCSFFGTHHWPPGTHQILMETGRFSGMFPINRHIFIYLYCKWHFVRQPRGDVAHWISWCSLNEDGTLNWGAYSRHLPWACFTDLFWTVTERCSLASREPVRIREWQSSEGYELTHLMTQR